MIQIAYDIKKCIYKYHLIYNFFSYSQHYLSNMLFRIQNLFSVNNDYIIAKTKLRHDDYNPYYDMMTTIHTSSFKTDIK